MSIFHTVVATLGKNYPIKEFRNNKTFTPRAWGMHVLICCSYVLLGIIKQHKTKQTNTQVSVSWLGLSAFVPPKKSMDIIYFLGILSSSAAEFLIGNRSCFFPFCSACILFVVCSKQHLSIDHEKFVSLSGSQRSL